MVATMEIDKPESSQPAVWSDIHPECATFVSATYCCRQVVFQKIVKQFDGKAPWEGSMDMLDYQAVDTHTAGSGREFVWFGCKFLDYQVLMPKPGSKEAKEREHRLAVYEAYRRTDQIMPCARGLVARTWGQGSNAGCYDMKDPVVAPDFERDPNTRKDPSLITRLLIPDSVRVLCEDFTASLSQYMESRIVKNKGQ